MRILILRIAVALCLGLLGISLFRVQVVKGDYYRQLGEKNRVRLIALEAPRGRVFDRRGKLLATNRASFNVVASPEDVTPEVFPLLADLLDLKEEEVRRRMSAPREFHYAEAMIMEDVSRELAFRIAERTPELPGVRIQTAGLRFYPYGETASHIIGFIGKLNRKEYKTMGQDWDRYGFNSLIGRMGIEKIYDGRLRGWRGGRQLEVNARGQVVQILNEKHPEPGEDLTLTIDLEFQEKIMELIKDQHAAVAVMDLASGELLAMASSPAYDPNVFVMPGRSQERLAFLRDKEAPMLDRGLGSAYPPGSVFKLVTALAALETGKINARTRFHCSGQYQIKPGTRPYKCWFGHGHGSIDLYEAIERSCNVYFYNLGRRLSADTIADYARRMGLGHELEMEMMNVVPGLVPDRTWKKKRYKEKWYQGETLSFAIGQSYLLTSPIQIMQLTGIIANGGKRVEPVLVKGDGGPRETERVAIREENLKVIKRGMLKVVESNFGTGQLARVEFDKMGGKTGTAQAPPHTAHSWMTGFFPYKNPEIVFVVFVEHGGPGGIASAEIVRSMLQSWRQINVPALG